jgi:hypothetical protein
MSAALETIRILSNKGLRVIFGSYEKALSSSSDHKKDHGNSSESHDFIAQKKRLSRGALFPWSTFEEITTLIYR